MIHVHKVAVHKCENWIHVKWNMKRRQWGEMGQVQTLIVDTYR